jgi:hypothetical protein
MILLRFNILNTLQESLLYQVLLIPLKCLLDHQVEYGIKVIIPYQAIHQE